MKHVRTFVAGAVVLAMTAAAAPAFAQLARGAMKWMTAEEMRGALFGIDMQGFTPTYGFEWRECIDPDGRALYEMPESVERGVMFVEEPDLACFSYEYDNHANVSCYTVARTTSGFVFEGVTNDGLFITTRVVTGVKRCEPDDLIG